MARHEAVMDGEFGRHVAFGQAGSWINHSIPLVGRKHTRVNKACTEEDVPCVGCNVLQETVIIWRLFVANKTMKLLEIPRSFPIYQE